MTQTERLKELMQAMDDLKFFDRWGKWPNNEVPEWVSIDIDKGFSVFRAIQRKREQAIDAFSHIINVKLENGFKQ